ncbi:hypothetical protein SAMN04488518_12036 [Pseudovibrio ascidiaceicola]|uniref:SnoaL-like domain-containing protein n=1 Tax=Pseudovibrio ascidiaceicola TaxID=285279 RepID=A0A1I4FPZ5_9HYPH|nr:nuclear transport factor 2 family protein [Pseudovibrio ascidiaceicola]SFL19027.1 hypothetical protein SAMN04488518_12036 [Pseudovibrio ascidiaceicola]
MDIRELNKTSLTPLSNMSVIEKYFAAVKEMDAHAVKGEKFNTDTIMELWHSGGTLSIHGKESIGEKSYTKHDEIAGFYQNRARGVDGMLATNLSKVNVANAKNDEHIVVSGLRYIINKKGEGLQAPFTHNFRLQDGRISSLDIHVGTPGKTEVAPVGALSIDDLGSLSAMAWMVA